MSAYAILDVDIHDLAQYQEYMKRAGPLVEAAGGRYLTRGGEHAVYEGDWQPTRVVIVEFPSYEAMDAFYHSDAYREAKAIRQGCSTTHMVAVRS